jgi:GNAT superfamily N-acetyltransferase
MRSDRHWPSPDDTHGRARHGLSACQTPSVGRDRPDPVMGWRVEARTAVPADVPELIRLRRLMIQAMGVDTSEPTWEAEAARVIVDGMASGSLVAVVVDAPPDGPDAALLASCVVQFEAHLPNPRTPTPVRAYISSMYTEPGWRRRGLATLVRLKLLDHCRQRARSSSCTPPRALGPCMRSTGSLPAAETSRCAGDRQPRPLPAIHSHLERQSDGTRNSARDTGPPATGTADQPNNEEEDDSAEQRPATAPAANAGPRFSMPCTLPSQSISNHAFSRPTAIHPIPMT